MTIFEIAPNSRGTYTNNALQGFLSEAGAAERKIIEIRDVKLHDGRILPNRKLARVVYDLADGRTVRVEMTSRYDGPSNNTYHGFKVIEVGA